MVLIPWRADEPLERVPWGTIGLISANLAVALLIGCVSPSLAFLRPRSSELMEHFVLRFDRFWPHTWLTSAFAHAGLLHLMGNMVFLWAFGVTIENRIGWRRFLSFYLGVALGEGLLTNICFLGWERAAIGASGAIMGSVAAAAVWVPMRNMTVWWFWYYLGGGSTTMRVWKVSLFYVAWDLVFGVFTGFRFGTPMLHLVGAGLGLAGAMLMLKQRWIETEGEDFFALRRRERERDALREAKRVERDLDPLAEGRWDGFRPDPVDYVSFGLLTGGVFLGGAGFVLLFGACSDLSAHGTGVSEVGRLLIAALLFGASLTCFRFWKAR